MQGLQRQLVVRAEETETSAAAPPPQAAETDDLLAEQLVSLETRQD
jgi:hypothetical protein